MPQLVRNLEPLEFADMNESDSDPTHSALAGGGFGAGKGWKKMIGTCCILLVSQSQTADSQGYLREGVGDL